MQSSLWQIVETLNYINVNLMLVLEGKLEDHLADHQEPPSGSHEYTVCTNVNLSNSCGDISVLAKVEAIQGTGHPYSHNTSLAKKKKKL